MTSESEQKGPERERISDSELNIRSFFLSQCELSSVFDLRKWVVDKENGN